MSCGIYKITNLINHKNYIGQSINIERRWKDEKDRAFNQNSNSYNSALSQSFRKYGLSNFSFEILEQCDIKDLDVKEIFYIEKYNSYYNGYNETTGGQGNPNAVCKISEKDLLSIYDLLLNSSKSQKEIAEIFSVGQDVISTINNGKSRRLSGYDYPLRDNHKVKNYCIDCGQIITDNAIRCDKCYKIKSRKVERPSRDELKHLIRTESFTSLGRIFNVSDKTISKWCTYYNLPSRKKDIKQYSDKEWLLI